MKFEDYKELLKKQNVELPEDIMKRVENRFNQGRQYVLEAPVIEKLQRRVMTKEKLRKVLVNTYTPDEIADILTEYIFKERKTRTDFRITISKEEFERHFHIRVPQTGKYSKKKKNESYVADEE